MPPLKSNRPKVGSPPPPTVLLTVPPLWLNVAPLLVPTIKYSPVWLGVSLSATAKVAFAGSGFQFSSPDQSAPSPPPSQVGSTRLVGPPNPDRRMIETVPKYQQMRRELRRDVRAGVWRPGQKIPSEAELMTRFRASRSTVLRALRDLKREGLLVGRQGAGNFVAERQEVDRPTATRFGVLSQQSPGHDPPSLLTEIQLRLGIVARDGDSEVSFERIFDNPGPLRAAEALLARDVKGVFYIPVEVEAGRDDPNPAVVRLLREQGVAVVLLDRDTLAYPDRSDLDLVAANQRLMGFRATEHLLASGRRRIAFIGVDTLAPAVIERRLGHLEALRRAGVSIDAVIRELRPDAILCKSDKLAARFMGELARRGVTCPGDVSLMGMGDEPFAALLPVPLSSVRVPIAEWAAIAWRTMRERLDHPDLAGRLVQLDVEVVDRATVAPPAGAD